MSTKQKRNALAHGGRLASLNRVRISNSTTMLFIVNGAMELSSQAFGTGIGSLAAAATLLDRLNRQGGGVTE